MKAKRPRLLLLLVAASACVALAQPLGAAADDDRGEARVTGTCTRTSESSLRLRADDGSIRVELRVDTRLRGATWNVIVLHERRIVFRGALQTSSSSGSLRLRRTVPDLFGPDTVVVRATGPRREACRVSATV